MDDGSSPRLLRDAKTAAHQLEITKQYAGLS